MTVKRTPSPATLEARAYAKYVRLKYKQEELTLRRNKAMGQYADKLNALATEIDVAGAALRALQAKAAETQPDEDDERKEP